MVLQQEHNLQKDEILRLQRNNTELEQQLTEYKVKSEILGKQLNSKDQLIDKN